MQLDLQRTVQIWSMIAALLRGDPVLTYFNVFRWNVCPGSFENSTVKLSRNSAPVLDDRSACIPSLQAGLRRWSFTGKSLLMLRSLVWISVPQYGKVVSEAVRGTQVPST